MSFARFSSDDFTSDVYAYVDANDNMITLHIAAARHNFDRSKLPGITADPRKDIQLYSEEWLQHHTALMQAIHSSEDMIIYEDEYAGRSYFQLTAEEAIALLDKLEQRGYHIPDGTREAIEEESDLSEDRVNEQPTIVYAEEKNTLGFIKCSEDSTHSRWR